VASTALATFGQILADKIDADIDVQEIAEYIYEKLKIEAANDINPQEIKLTDQIFKEIYQNLGLNL
jgi:hypothetical protein